MINYEFYKNEIGTPQFSVKGDLQGLNELGSCNFEYLQEIVANLSKVISGELEQYDFGYEVYSIECKKEISQVIDTYNDWKCISEITTKEIYRLMIDWMDYLIDNSITIDNNLKNDLEISFNYIFFDGLKSHPVINQYDDWLTSTDFSVWSNSYVEIQNKRIYIIKENVKVLSTFRYFDKIELELLANKYNFKIKEENGIYYAYTEDHSSRQFEISENDELTVIYCMEGGNLPESIFIYGVYENR
jgi:hypothetical protein